VPHLPENARLWLERTEIDYIGPFVKAWAAFNAWYRHASGSRKDSDGLRYVKKQINPVRSEIKPLLRAREFDEHGKPRPEPEDALQFKALVRNLHACLDNYHIETLRDDVVERISFRTVCLSTGVQLPKKRLHRKHEYVVEKRSAVWASVVQSRSTGQETERIEQSQFDVIELQSHEGFQRLTPEQRGQLLGLYNECNPRPFTDLLAGSNSPIVAGDIEFRCNDDQLFAGLMEIIYALRNALLHGELQPHDQAFEAYEQAYRIVMRFLQCLRG
jgi:hypothetical protein